MDISTREEDFIHTVNVCTNAVHNSQRMDATQIPFNEWVIKLWYTHTTEYYSATRENKLLILNNLDDSIENYVEWKMPLLIRWTCEHGVSPPLQPSQATSAAEGPEILSHSLIQSTGGCIRRHIAASETKRLFLFKSYPNMEISKLSNYEAPCSASLHWYTWWSHCCPICPSIYTPGHL